MEQAEDLIRVSWPQMTGSVIATGSSPAKLNFYYLPVFLIVPIYMLLMNTKIAEFALAKHTIVAKDEMEVLEKQFRSLI